VAEGWEPLCGFLDVPRPPQPFPRLNDTAKMRRWISTTRVATRIGPLLAAGAAAYGAARAQVPPAAWDRSTYLSTLPVAVSGSASTTATLRGAL